MRIGNREHDDLRDVKITKDYTRYAEGSVLIEMGHTKVICTASIEDKVPPFLKNSGTGWISAEYSMLPRATAQRKIRESSRGKVDGRTQEIQRLIGRALRSVIDLKALGERTIWIDCDVIQADGGTRTASITGAFVAMADAIYKLYKSRAISKFPIKSFVSAISVGIVNGEKLVDLCYEEDSTAQVDMNFVMTDAGEFVEVQGTGEESPFKKQELYDMLDLAESANNKLIQKQKEVIDYVAKEINKKNKKDVIIATSNAHKLQEIGKMLNTAYINVLSMKSANLEGLEIEETGATFEENALIKARTVMQKTGKISIADDSGLVVEALDGKPGIYSSRFAGENATDEENRKKILKMLEKCNITQRGAKFVCCIAVVFPNGEEFTVTGSCSGKIGFEEKGNNGFGYDCIFIVDKYNKTFGELSEDIKNSISHRYNALQKMKREFERRLI